MLISFDFSELAAITKRVRRSPEKLRQERNTALKVARKRLAERVDKGFDKSIDPYGARWADITHRDGKPLVDTGNLRRSIRSRTINNKKGGRIVFFENTRYGKYHQNGTRRIRKRAFLPDERGLPESWSKIIRSELRKRLGNKIAGGII